MTDDDGDLGSGSDPFEMPADWEGFDLPEDFNPDDVPWNWDDIQTWDDFYDAIAEAYEVPDDDVSSSGIPSAG